MARERRSLSLPIVLASVAVALSITLLVFWLLIVVREFELGPEVSTNTWLIVLGSVSFAFIMVVLVLFSVFLVAETREVRRQDRFIDSVTHELKSPLAAIRLGLETLGREGLEPKQRERLREMMLADVDRLHAFIDSILEASRLAHERGGHDLQAYDVEAVLRDVIARLVHRHRVDPGCVTLEAPAELILRTDRPAFETILGNLIDNALKYSDAPAKVVVRAAEAANDQIAFAVEDQGIGIPQADLKNVILRFYRAPGDQVRRRRGTGLGLYVVHALVAELGGRMRIESDGPGHGTRVRVWLPGRQARGPTTPSPERAGAADA